MYLFLQEDSHTAITQHKLCQFIYRLFPFLQKMSTSYKVIPLLQKDVLVQTAIIGPFHIISSFIPWRYWLLYFFKTVFNRTQIRLGTYFLRNPIESIVKIIWFFPIKIGRKDKKLKIKLKWNKMWNKKS